MSLHNIELSQMLFSQRLTFTKCLHKDEPSLNVFIKMNLHNIELSQRRAFTNVVFTKMNLHDIEYKIYLLNILLAKCNFTNGCFAFIEIRSTSQNNR